jgi:methionyl-tRNA formyltransferase
VFDTSEELASHLVDTKIDLGVLAWWPKIIKSPLLETPRLGFVNTHPSLLPSNRGKHYNFWAIVEEASFGVSLHCVDSGIDSGDIVAQQRIAYDWCDNGGSLYRKAQEAMVDLFRATYPSLRKGQFPRYPQDMNKGSFHLASELEQTSHLELDASYRGREVLNLLRARTFPGHPGCWFEDNGERFEVRIDIRRAEK